MTLHAKSEVLSLSPDVLGSSWGVVVACGAYRVSPGSVSWASKREQTWTISFCLAELLEFACVESEGSVVPLVSHAVPWAFDRVHM